MRKAFVIRDFAYISFFNNGFAIVASFPELAHIPIVLGESDPEGCAACPVRTNPSNAYEMDVYRGGCAAGNRLVAAEKTSFDWYTDFTKTSNGCTISAPCGEGNCLTSPGPNQNTCSDDSAVFYVAVRRTDGQASCAAFTVQMSNGVY